MLLKSKSKPDAGELSASAEKSSYVRGREEWLERYGSYIQRARQWRMAAFIALGITGISVMGNVVQATQSKVVPYVVEVDQLGRVAAVYYPIRQIVYYLFHMACILIAYHCLNSD